MGGHADLRAVGTTSVSNRNETRAPLPLLARSTEMISPTTFAPAGITARPLTGTFCIMRTLTVLPGRALVKRSTTPGWREGWFQAKFPFARLNPRRRIAREARMRPRWPVVSCKYYCERQDRLQACKNSRSADSPDPDPFGGGLADVNARRAAAGDGKSHGFVIFALVNAKARSGSKIEIHEKLRKCGSSRKRAELRTSGPLLIPKGAPLHVCGGDSACRRREERREGSDRRARNA